MTLSRAQAIPGRTYFKPSGNVTWGSFVPWLLLPFGLAAALAMLIFWLFYIGHYYVGIVPALAAVAVAACLKLAVNKGHCRSRVVAGMAGACAGIILYLGYYYCGMVYQLGPSAAGRLDLLPHYLRFRTENDVLSDSHESSRTAASREGNSLANWGVFAFESLFVLAITIGAALSRARRPYCEVCRKWMLREVTLFEPDKANEIIDSFRKGSAGSLAVLASAPEFATVPSTILAISYCPSLKEGLGRDCPSYVSVKQITRTGGGTPTLDPFDSGKGKVLLRTLALNKDEVVALGVRFEKLSQVVGRSAMADMTEEKPQPKPSLESNDLPVAEIYSVGTEFSQRVLTKRNALIGTAWAFSALLFLFAGLGLALWGGMTAFPDDKSIAVSPETKAFGTGLLVAGGLLFVSAVIFFLVNPTYLGNRYLMKVVRREFARRTGCVVDYRDPEALFVEVVPKLNWGKIQLESASDIGFLRVDTQRRELLFEGDRERWRIPAAAILSCGVEFFIEGQGSHGATKLFYVVVRARLPGQFWEAPIRPRRAAGQFAAKRRKRAAEELCKSIQAM